MKQTLIIIAKTVGTILIVLTFTVATCGSCAAYGLGVAQLIREIKQ